VGLVATHALAHTALGRAGRPVVLHSPWPHSWAAMGARTQLPAAAARAGVRRRFAPHQLRHAHAHAVEMSREGVPQLVIQRQLGHADLAITSVYLRGIDNTEIVHTVHERPAPMVPALASSHASGWRRTERYGTRKAVARRGGALSRDRPLSAPPGRDRRYRPPQHLASPRRRSDGRHAPGSAVDAVVSRPTAGAGSSHVRSPPTRCWNTPLHRRRRPDSDPQHSDSHTRVR
jgi:integrase-like protein